MEYVSKEDVINLVQEIVHDPNVVHKCRSIRKRINSLLTLEYDGSNLLKNTFEKNCQYVKGCMNILNWYRNLYYKESMDTE